MINRLKVRIISPKQTIFEGLADSVSSVNSAGRFDILFEHANLITLINNQPIILKGLDNQRTQEFRFQIAIIYASQNQVRIYTV